MDAFRTFGRGGLVAYYLFHVRFELSGESASRDVVTGRLYRLAVSSFGGA